MKIIQSIFNTLFLSSRHSDQELLFAAISSYKKEHRGEFQLAGSYSRKLFSPGHFDFADKETDITLPRIRFKKGCGDEGNAPSATHTLSADILIPGSSYSIRAVLTVLYDALHWEGTLKELCAKYGISISTYYTWKKLFEAHCASWNRSLMEASKLCNDLFSAMQSIPELPWRFLQTFAVSFLQSRCRDFSILAPASGDAAPGHAP